LLRFHGELRTTTGLFSVYSEQSPYFVVRPGNPGEYRDVDGIADLADNFDQVALVVDWLDACRITISPRCSISMRMMRRSNAAAAKQRSAKAAPNSNPTGSRASMRLRPPRRAGEVTPTAEGVVLDYLSNEGKPVRIVFGFTHDGKIRQTSCAPARASFAAAGG